MQWTDEGIILGTRRHGETSLIVELMTIGHGRHLGLVKGGRSRRWHSLLQPGNSVLATWRARLSEHLGNYAVEPLRPRAAVLMESAAGLYGFKTLAALTRLLPERDPHAAIHDALAAVLDALDGPAVTAELVIRYEMQLLAELGFGLDLTRCAATGSTADLAYVSPKTGRAVSREAAAPYRDRMLSLPGFLLERGPEAPGAGALRAGFALTGFFLDRHVYEPRGVEPPEARASLIALLGE